MPDDDSKWIELIQSIDLDGYSVGDLRGNGGFAFVFEGQRTSTGAVVALKVLSPLSRSGEAREFEREGDLLKILERSSNVVNLIDSRQASVSLQHNGLSVPISLRYHVLELSSGSLDELVQKLSELSWPERLSLWRAAIRGVHQMHLKSIVHRDLKSANCLIFVHRNKATDCKVADLGRSRNLSDPPAADPREYLAGRGDLRFAPPECILLQAQESSVGHRAADLYGLGSLFFELATGQGITSYALGIDPSDIRQAMHRLQQRSVMDVEALRPGYMEALDLLANVVPVAIRDRAVSLVSQLSDPVPSNRFPKTGPGRRGPRTAGLEWLIRQADILIKVLRTQTSTRSGMSRKGAS